jgi:hypothetical protein
MNIKGCKPTNQIAPSDFNKYDFQEKGVKQKLYVV